MTEPRHVGAWDRHHRGQKGRWSYGVSSLPEIADWLIGLDTVEDWGCGGGLLADYLHPPTRYIGVDGSATPFADIHADLRTYRSTVPGIAMRHVLEHNDDWQTVLANAIDSFTDRMIVVLFTPLSTETRVIFREVDYGHVPVIAFRIGDLLAEFPDDVTVQVDWRASPDTAFSIETFIRAER